jgi:hypothetical protein
MLAEDRVLLFVLTRRAQSQYLDVIDRPGGGDDTSTVFDHPLEVRVVVPPGTILLHHYEISHRATGRTDQAAPFRCMFKLQVCVWDWPLCSRQPSMGLKTRADSLRDAQSPLRPLHRHKAPLRIHSLTIRSGLCLRPGPG